MFGSISVVNHQFITLTGRGVDELHGERLAEIVLRPDAVLPVVVLAEARREEAARVAEVHNLQCNERYKSDGLRHIFWDSERRNRLLNRVRVHVHTFIALNFLRNARP